MFVKKVIKNDKNFSQSYLLNDDKLFLSVFYNFHPGDQQERHLWGILDLNKQKITSVQRMPEEDVHFSHFVNDLVNVKDNKIMLSESSLYKIFFYDEEFNKTDSIYSEELDDFKNQQIIYKDLFNSLDSKDAIYKLKTLDDSLFTRIRKVFFIDTNNVMVILKLAGQESLRVDYWGKSDNTWERKIIDSSSVWFVQGQQYNDSMYCYTDFYQNMSSIIALGDNQFGLFYYPYIATPNTRSFDKEKDYFYKQNRNIRNENSFIGFKTIRIGAFSN
ncbi:MAG: hypothetical protein JJT77_13985 [Crocinitomicaceae bacterium]|nr:hypothetical protein [Crocinitomicaceae bacterium]